MIVVQLAEGPLPHFLALQNWQWETKVNATKYLGIYMVDQISSTITKEQLFIKIDKCLEKASRHQLSLTGRIIVANHIIQATLWYLLAIWVGDDEDIRQVEQTIKHYIWTQNKSTRHKVNFDTITLPKKEGGLGLISIAHQTKALAAKILVGQFRTAIIPLKLFCNPESWIYQNKNLVYEIIPRFSIQTGLIQD